MCGLVQSILATVPVTVTGWLPSYSAANEWCASMDVADIASIAAVRARRRCLIARCASYNTRDEYVDPAGRALDDTACADRDGTYRVARDDVSESSGEHRPDGGESGRLPVRDRGVLRFRHGGRRAVHD